jgi:hypothetical protein
LCNTHNENPVLVHSELAEIVTAWPELPPSFRLALLTIVRLPSTWASGTEGR